MTAPARLAGVGLFVLTGLLLFAVALFMIGERRLAFDRKLVVYTEFRNITGLQPGAIVRVSGATAGSLRTSRRRLIRTANFECASKSQRICTSSHAPTRWRRFRRRDSSEIVSRRQHGNVGDATRRGFDDPQSRALPAVRPVPADERHR